MLHAEHTVLDEQAVQGATHGLHVPWEFVHCPAAHAEQVDVVGDRAPVVHDRQVVAEVEHDAHGAVHGAHEVPEENVPNGHCDAERQLEPDKNNPAVHVTQVRRLVLHVAHPLVHWRLMASATESRQ